jgi:hypothetical protein
MRMIAPNGARSRSRPRMSSRIWQWSRAGICTQQDHLPRPAGQSPGASHLESKTCPLGLFRSASSRHAPHSPDFSRTCPSQHFELPCTRRSGTTPKYAAALHGESLGSPPARRTRWLSGRSIALDVDPDNSSDSLQRCYQDQEGTQAFAVLHNM